MKAILMTITMLMIGTTSAQATSPRRDVPLRQAELRRLEKLDVPTGKVLTMYGIVGERFTLHPSLLVLREDTGIRCIKAPCPSESYTQFRITKATNIFGASMKYEAVEEYTTTPGQKPGQGHGGGNLGRKLVLIDHSKNVHFAQYVWNLVLTNGAGVSEKLVGNPSAIRMLTTVPEVLPPQLGEENLDESNQEATLPLEIPRDVELPTEASGLSSAMLPRKLVADLKATLVEHRGPQEIGKHLQKTLTRETLQGSTKPVAFTFFEEKQVYCVTAPCPPVPVTRHFAIVSVENAGCGSLRYIAKEANPGRGALEVVDHSARRCEDYRPYRWEITLHDHRVTRTLSGNPKAVELGLSHLDD